MKTSLDLRLYALADPAAAPSDDLPRLTEAALAGGATLVQLRDKTGDGRALVARAAALLDVTRPRGVPLLVNDHVDVALAIGADGVHLGQDDMSPAEARAFLGPDAIVGLTIRSEDEARAMPADLIDYAAIGGVFATASKADAAAPIGLDGLARIAALIRARAPGLPICAIAGMNEDTAGPTIMAGADGVAVISGLFRIAEPQAVEAAARTMRAAVDRALNDRRAA